MSKRWITILSVCLCAVGADVAAQARNDATPPAPPTAPDDARKAVAFLLSAHHDLPPRQQFEEAAPDAKRTLFDIAATSGGPIAERAVEALFMWQSNDVFAWGALALGSADTSEGRRHRLMMLMAKTFGARAVQPIAPYLRSDERRLRLTAAAALAAIRTEEAFALIDAALEREKDPAARRELQRYARRVVR